MPSSPQVSQQPVKSIPSSTENVGGSDIKEEQKNVLSRKREF